MVGSTGLAGVLDGMTTLMVLCGPKRPDAATRGRAWTGAGFGGLLVRLLVGLQPDLGRTGITQAGVEEPGHPGR